MNQYLLVFVTVVEKGNFSRAAESLHMTQPAVSQCIKALERELGMKLLDRTNKYVHINKPGEIVYDYGKQILGLYEKMGNLLDDLSQEAKGPINIGASYTYGEYVLPSVITILQKEYPAIQPAVTINNTKEIAELVLRHQLDIGIIEGDFQDDHLQIEAFSEDAMFVIASSEHPLAKQDTMKLIDLENATWIVREQGSGTREATEKLFRQLSIAPKEILEFGSTQLIKESVQNNLGVTFLSQLAVRKETLLGLLKILPVEKTPLVRNFSVILQKSSYKTKALEAFLHLIEP